MERSAIRTHIEEALDSNGIIQQDVDAGLPQTQGVRAYAEEMVAGLNDAFSDEGGAGVTVEEIAAYVEWLIERREGSRGQ